MEFDNLELAIRKNELQVESLKQEMEENVLIAETAGIVRTASDPKEAVRQGQPVITVQGRSGNFLKGQMNEELAAAAAAYYRRDHAGLYWGMNGLEGGSVLGIGPDFLPAAGFRVKMGRGLSERDVEERKRAALLDGRAGVSSGKCLGRSKRSVAMGRVSCYRGLPCAGRKILLTVRLLYGL